MYQTKWNLQRPQAWVIRTPLRTISCCSKWLLYDYHSVHLCEILSLQQSFFPPHLRVLINALTLQSCNISSLSSKRTVLLCAIYCTLRKAALKHCDFVFLCPALNAAVVSFAINETSSSIFIVITEDLESMFTSCQFKVKMEWEMLSSPQTGINTPLSPMSQQYLES